MLRLSEIKKRIQDYNLAKIAKAIGVSYSKLRYAVKGNNPPYYVVEKLSDYLEGKKNG